jgi:hypothetical protein
LYNCGIGIVEKMHFVAHYFRLTSDVRIAYCLVFVELSKVFLMITRRLGELRNVALELKRCTAKINDINKKLAQPASNPVHMQKRNTSARGAPRQGAKDLQFQEASAFDAYQDQYHARSALEAVRDKLLFRKIPIALSRFERSLVIPVRLRKQPKSSPLSVTGEAAEALLPKAPDRSLNVLEDREGSIVQSSAAPSSNIVEELGIQEPRGPEWRISSRSRLPSNDHFAISSRVSLSSTHAFQILQMIGKLDRERNSFFQSEQDTLNKQLAGAQRNILNRSTAIKSALESGEHSAEKLDVNNDEYLLQEHATLKRLQATRDSLRHSVIARPYLSAFLWKSLLQPDFLNALLSPVGVPSFLQPDVSVSSLVAGGSQRSVAAALLPAASLCSLVLGVLASSQEINKMCPRFVVSLRQLSEEVAQNDGGVETSGKSMQQSVKSPGVRWIPQQASSQVVPLTWLSIHAIGNVLAAAFGKDASSQAQTKHDDAKRESELVENIAAVCELVQGLQALCSSIILLDRSVSTSNEKRRVLHVAEVGLLGASEFLLRNAPVCSQALSQDQACRLLSTLFRLHAVVPERKQSQMAVSCLMARVFPILSSETYATLSHKLRQQASGSIFANLTKKHKSHLRRKHAVTTPNAASAVIANTIAEHRINSRQMSAALKLRRMTELYGKNIAVLEPHPLSTVVLLFQIVCMSASSRNVPPPAARLLIGAGCLVGEALLGKLTSRPAIKFDAGVEAVAVEFERLTALIMAASAAVPVARDIVGLLPKESKNVSGEHYFMSELLVHFLRCVAALAAEALQRMGTLSSMEKREQVLESFPLKQFVYLFDALGEIQTAQDLRRGELSTKNQAKETLQLLKALLGAAGQSWWTKELSSTASGSQQTHVMVHIGVREKYYDVMMTSLRAYDIMDAAFEDNVSRMMKLS